MSTDLIFVEKIGLIRTYIEFIRFNSIFRGYPRNSGRFALVKAKNNIWGPELLYLANIFKGKFLFPGNMSSKKLKLNIKNFDVLFDLVRSINKLLL